MTTKLIFVTSLLAAFILPLGSTADAKSRPKQKQDIQAVCWARCQNAPPRERGICSNICVRRNLELRGASVIR